MPLLKIAGGRVKCRRCGYISFVRDQACRNCGWIYGRYPVLVRTQNSVPGQAEHERLVRIVAARVEELLFGPEEPPNDRPSSQGPRLAASRPVGALSRCRAP